MILCSKCKKNTINYYLKIYHCKECDLSEFVRVLKLIDEEFTYRYVAYNGNSTQYHKHKIKR